MKKLILFVGAIAIASVGSVFADEVDFHTLNPVLQSLADAVIVADDLVDFAYPRFDESFCDIKAEKIKYDLLGSLKNTPWLDGSRADVLATATYIADRTQGHSGIRITTGSTVRTDTLALIRYAAYLGLKKGYFDDPKFGERTKAHLQRLAVATSLDQVYTLALSGQALSKEIANSRVTKEMDYLKCLQSGPCFVPGQMGQDAIKVQLQFIEKVKATLPAYDRVQVVAQREGDHIRQLTISSPDISQGMIAYGPDFARMPKPGRGEIVLDDASVTANLEVFSPVDQAGLDKMKQTDTQKLIKIQNGVTADKDDAQNLFRDVLVSFKKLIRGDF